MGILFTGKGKAGSWKIRGEQLGSLVGTAIPDARKLDGYDLAVIVKRLPQAKLSIPWVFDAVDFYPQPLSDQWSASEAISWVKRKVELMNPVGVIWATQKMQDDCSDGRPSIVLPHHCRPGIKLNPIREKVSVVGYEGRAEYLGRWRTVLEESCAARGWRFTVTPDHVADLDIVVSFRDGAGYASQNWKPHTKLANAHGSGTPFVGHPETGCLEMQTGAEYWATSRKELNTAFDWLTDQSAREHIRDRFIDRAFHVEQAADLLKNFLCTLK